MTQHHPEHATDEQDIPPVPRVEPAVEPSGPPHGTGAAVEATGPAHGAGASHAAGADHGAGAALDRPLIAQGDREKADLLMRQAVNDFVESPRRAVEEADNAFERIVTGLTDALAERRHALRASWRDQDTEARTEELRIALQHYRDTAERLLRI